MTAAAKIEQLIAPTLSAMGFSLVRVKLQGGQRPVLQIMAERDSGGQPHDGGFTIEDCSEISRAVSAILDVEDPIPEAYNLEVSSPGLDRPLVKFADFARFKGFAARIELGVPHEGRKRFRGLLIGTEGSNTVLLQDDEAKEPTKWALPFADIASAKLVLTDELLRYGASLKAGADQAEPVN